MKILLAVDGSACTRRMLAYIAAHDELLGRGHELTALTVLPPIPARAAALLPRATMDDWYHDEAEQVLAPVRAFAAQNGWTLQTQRAVGHAGDAIAELAEAGDHDLIVMGTHGHGAVANVVMGSVATRVLARSKRPVLLVH